MENIEYANAYKEVIEILKYIPKEECNKIPPNRIALFEEKANKNYKFTYNPTVSLEKQNVSKRANAIIVILFRDYWATPEQREKIIAKQNDDRKKMEMEKVKKYNPDDIFKKKSVNDQIQGQDEVSVIKKEKDKWYSKILLILKNYFKTK